MLENPVNINALKRRVTLNVIGLLLLLRNLVGVFNVKFGLSTRKGI